MIPRPPFPGTSISASRLALGTAFLGLKQTEPEAFALLDHYVALGGNFIDTARVYSDWVPGEPGRVERILGDWFRARPGLRNQLIIATKGLHYHFEKPNVPRVTPAAAQNDIDASLRALGTDYLDLYWLHRDDPTLPPEDIIDFMQPFVRAGKVRHLGASNWAFARLAAANAHAHAHGLTPFVASQPLFHIGCWSLPPAPDPTLVPLDRAAYAAHRDTGLPLVAYSPQAQGFFSRLAAGRATPDERCATAANLRLGPVLVELANRHATSVNAIVLAYLLHQPFPVFPVLGPNRPEQLDDSLRALAVKLTPENIDQLDRLNGLSPDSPKP
jgi:aryl-alcohol dehydrogenase-like predicted oxidoreductase